MTNKAGKTHPHIYCSIALHSDQRGRSHFLHTVAQGKSHRSPKDLCHIPTETKICTKIIKADTADLGGLDENN